MSNDLINGAFELVAAIFILNHARVLYEHKKVRGVSLLSTYFFTSWGFWNVFYYPSLGQSFSFYAGIAVVLANMVWLSLMVYYVRRERAGIIRDGSAWH